MNTKDQELQELRACIVDHGHNLAEFGRKVDELGWLGRTDAAELVAGADGDARLITALEDKNKQLLHVNQELTTENRMLERDNAKLTARLEELGERLA